MTRPSCGIEGTGKKRDLKGRQDHHASVGAQPEQTAATGGKKKIAFLEREKGRKIPMSLATHRTRPL